MVSARTLVLIGVFSYMHVSWADNILDCVDSDIARTLLGSPGEGVIQISREWPERFPPVALPETFTLLGSRTSSRFLMVSFKSALSVADAKSRVEDSMSGAAWQLPESLQRRATGGFQGTPVTSIRDTVTFCHDDHGYVTAMFSESADTTYVTLMKTGQRSRSQCNSPQQRSVMSGGNVVDLPILSLPEGAAGSRRQRRGGENASTSIELDTKLQPNDLLNFFGAQLAAQDWLEEGQWIGDYVSGSAWLSKDEKASGLLRVVDYGEEQYKLSFETIRHRLNY